jgi:hypothetical protein
MPLCPGLILPLFHSIQTLLWNHYHLLPRLNALELFDILIESIWLKSYISLAPIYCYVAACEISGNPFTGHMRVTLCTIQWIWWLRDHEHVTKVLFMLRAIRLVEKNHNRCYHVIYSWH